MTFECATLRILWSSINLFDVGICCGTTLPICYKNYTSRCRIKICVEQIYLQAKQMIFECATLNILQSSINLFVWNKKKKWSTPYVPHMAVKNGLTTINMVSLSLHPIIKVDAICPMSAISSMNLSHPIFHLRMNGPPIVVGMFTNLSPHSILLVCSFIWKQNNVYLNLCRHIAIGRSVDSPL